MNQPPHLSEVPQTTKSSAPTVWIILLVVGVVGIVGVGMIGLLAAIAIPNFVKARQTAQMNQCMNNLRMIDSAKQQWALEHKKDAADTPTRDELAIYFRNGPFPVCSAGGVYTINAVGEAPVCSVPTHSLSGHSPPFNQ